MSNSAAAEASIVIGWIYFVAWSVSFYGQLYENWKNKSVEGYSLKFQILNMIGFAFYTMYNLFGYYQKDPGVDPNDIVFAIHAISILCITGLQCLYYPRGKNQVGLPTWIFSGCLFFGGVLYLLLNNVFKVTHVWNQYYDAVSLLGYGKMTVTFLKYCPQVYWNYKRKTTKGWSIFNIFMDLTGGIFSFAQIILDAIRLGHSDVFSGGLNITKFALSISSIMFDSIFLTQHYLLYPQRKKVAEKNLLIQQEFNDNEKQTFVNSQNNPNSDNYNRAFKDRKLGDNNKYQQN